MRKVIVMMHISLDGFAVSNEGTGLEWTFRGISDEVSQAAYENMRDVDTIIWGRSTYQGMYSYWPTVPANPESKPDEIEHAHWLDRTTKLVFSTTLETAEWVNSKLIKGNIAEEINTLKRQEGQNMLILGSPRLAHSFMALNLIDEYRLFLHPVTLGEGLPLFKEQAYLKLSATKTFANGVVHLRYQPDAQ
ncbi:dihydrofolate reductase [Ktedonosporobacter rubrisoli]|uniref:Dihydrofolate reductase n=1 Tax=Ktedonosporobacter rubrisoli TaxID=2509675 RepID=A0A4P6JZM9_KTERU|nr:dihydrofolate reductase family protein [Ktedonosporobacter rubrisoli]QBD81287.1 dihydrofolate reductase [Ktedonosporobacter rubrisoli]